jgi:predicted phage tail protein
MQLVRSKPSTRYLIESTGRPSPLAILRGALMAIAVSTLYVGVLAALGLFGGAIWWLSIGGASLVFLGVLQLTLSR